MRLDMTTGTWSTGPAWTAARADLALASDGVKLYAIGGDTTGGSYFDPSNLVNEYTLASWPGGSWSASLPNLPAARQANQAGYYSTGRAGGEIWSTGGRSGRLHRRAHLPRGRALRHAWPNRHEHAARADRDEHAARADRDEAPICPAPGWPNGPASGQPDGPGSTRRARVFTRRSEQRRRRCTSYRYDVGTNAWATIAPLTAARSAWHGERRTYPNTLGGWDGAINDVPLRPAATPTTTAPLTTATTAQPRFLTATSTASAAVSATAPARPRR
jgi:hypothetical protein